MPTPPLALGVLIHLKITRQRASYAVEPQMTATVEMQLGRAQAEATQRLLAEARTKRPW